MLSGVFDFLEEKKIISLSQLFSEYLASKKPYVRPTTYRRYRNYLNPFRNHLSKFFPEAANDISIIKTIYVNEIFSLLQKENEWENKTLNGTRECIKAAFRLAIDEDYIEKNPLDKLKKFPELEKGKIRFYSDEELKRIFKIVEPFWRDVLEFLYLTGLRKAEMINLTWDKVSLKNENPQIIISSDENWVTKTGKSRAVPLNEKARNIILKKKGINKIYVFTDKNNKKIHPDRPYHALKNALKKIGIDGDIHKFRHTFAAKLVMSGESLYTVGKLLGHSDSKTTEKYAHLAPDYLASAVNKL